MIAVSLVIPSFADEISDSLTDLSGTNATNETNNTVNDTLGNNSSTINNSTLTSTQIQTLNDTQNKLADLIAKITGLKATYGNNTKAKGLLNALTQFEKQANRLNSEISVFIQNPTINNATEGRINSFVKREAALEHKVMIKERLLLKISTKQVKDKNNNANKNKHIKKQKKDK